MSPLLPERVSKMAGESFLLLAWQGPWYRWLMVIANQLHYYPEQQTSVKSPPTVRMAASALTRSSKCMQHALQKPVGERSQHPTSAINSTATKVRAAGSTWHQLPMSSKITGGWNDVIGQGYSTLPPSPTTLPCLFTFLSSKAYSSEVY